MLNYSVAELRGNIPVRKLSASRPKTHSFMEKVYAMNKKLCSEALQSF